MSGIQWQDKERSFQALKHPLWDYNDNVLGSVLSPCLDPSASPQLNSILQYLIHSLGKQTTFNWIQRCALTTIFFNGIWWLLFSHGFTLYEIVVQPRTARTLLTLYGWDIAQHLMLGSCYQEKWWERMKISLFHTPIASQILIFLHRDFSSHCFYEDVS